MFFAAVVVVLLMVAGALVDRSLPFARRKEWSGFAIRFASAGLCVVVAGWLGAWPPLS